MSTLAPPKPSRYAVDRLCRETGRDREECERAYEFYECLYEPAKQALLNRNDRPAWTQPVERRRSAALPKQREETPARFTPPASAFPAPLSTVTVKLPGDGSPEEITAYFNRTYGVTRTNSTAERARKLCKKLAENAAAQIAIVERYAE